ncbi:MAG: hypothetical protein ACAH09_04520 [Methylophilaceae bacterium]|nr:hypothetical protein [Methylophilaceae bacterium]
MTALNGFSKLLTSLLMLGAFILAIVITAYQIFSPEGHFFLWLQEVWETSPLLIVTMGIFMLLGKRWID